MQKFEEKIYEEQRILECHRVTGESSYYLKVAVHSMKELEELIDIVIPFGTVKTSMILSSPIPYRCGNYRITIKRIDRDRSFTLLHLRKIAL